MYNNETKIKLNLGEGNYIVTATINAIIFKKIDKKLQVGSVVDGINYSDNFNIVDIYTVPFHDYLEVHQFKKLLTESYETKTFIFNDISFDFSNYNRKSIDCILDQLSWVEHFIPKAQII